MAESSPGLSNPASNFSPELSNNSAPEIFHSNLAAQKETSARLASEFLAGQHPGGGGAEGLKRAANVLAGGLADGIVDSAKNSLNLHTAENVASTLGIGYGLGAIARTGPVGEKIAMVSGLAMGAKWIYSELESGRPQVALSAVEDAYHSKDNTERDRKIFASTGGVMAFETGLAFAAGGYGMKKGLELKPGWQADALLSAKTTYGNAMDFLARDGRVNGTHVLKENNMGLAFAGKDAAVSGPMSAAKDIVMGKDKGGTSLAEIQQTFARTQAKRNDAHLLDIQGKLTELDAEHTRIRNEEAALNPKLTAATKEKAGLESLSSLETNVRVRQQTLADAQQAARDIPVKKRELDKMFQDKQAAFELQKPKPGEQSDPALRQDFQTKHQAFQEAKAKYDELKTTGSAENIQAQREALQEAQQALTQARESQPAKLDAAQKQIDAINEQMGTLKTQRLAVEGQAKPLVDAYNTRLKEVLDDPAKLVQAQFEPPVEKAAPKAKTGDKGGDKPADALAVDLKPSIVSSSGEIGTAGGEINTATLRDAATTHEVVTTHEPVSAPVTAHETVAGLHTDAAVKAGGNEATVTHTEPVVTAEVKPAAQPVVETATAGKDVVAKEPVKDAAAVTEAPGVKILSRDAMTARENAMNSVKSNELVRERDYATRILEEINRGTYRPARGASVEDVRTEMQRRVENVNEKLGNDPGIKYTRALKSVLNYTRSIGKQLAETADSGMRDNITQQALLDIEGMMGRLPTSYNGVPGKFPNLMEPTRGRVGSPEKRLADLTEHLENKVSSLDNSRAKQVADMAERQPTLNEIMKRLNAKELPDDGSIILIGKDGKYLGPKGGTSPYFIEVSRMQAHGVGADGGGFNRFEAIQNDIAGAVVLRPLYENGKPIELPGRSSAGKPVYKKIVAETFGDVPAGITADLNFVDILRRFAPARN